MLIERIWSANAFRNYHYLIACPESGEALAVDPLEWPLVLAAAQAAPVTIAWLPFRSPELNPLEDLWRLLKAVVAAHRVDDTLDALAAHALAWLAACLPATLLTRCGLRSSKFDWLPT